MQYLAEALAFIAVLAAAVALNLRGKEAEVLWVMVMAWALLIGWRIIEEKKDN